MTLHPTVTTDGAIPAEPIAASAAVKVAAGTEANRTAAPLITVPLARGPGIEVEQ